MLADVLLTEFIDLPQQGGADQEVLLGALGILRHSEAGSQKNETQYLKLQRRFNPTQRGYQESNGKSDK
jgi:hypothetical protein